MGLIEEKMMQELSHEQLKAAIKEVWIKSLTDLPSDVEKALVSAKEAETNPRAKTFLGVIIENARIAKEKHTVICQDTGVPTFEVTTSLGFPFRGSFERAFREAMHELTTDEFPMRPMVVNPLTREDNCDNTGINVPVIHYKLEEDLDYIEIKAIPKGAGTGMWSTLSILPYAEGSAGVKKFVIESVLKAGSNPCLPLIVGVGIGGTLDETARLATVASNRRVDERNSSPELRELEEELKAAINMSGIGALGVGGDISVLAVNVELSSCHKPWLPVAVSFNCWPGRRAKCRIYADGHTEKLEA